MLQDVLLHEMIHALLFTNGQNRRDGDHGPRFRAKMHDINASSLPDHQVLHYGYCPSCSLVVGSVRKS